jgi:UDP-2-acetamido-2-deoxy-ribo-hexuluronate aminotransferase
VEFIDLKTQQTRIKTKIDQRIQLVLAHGKYIMGPEVFELEKKLAEYVGVKHCITNASGTDALLMAEMALGLGAGDEVITTPLTWVSTVETLHLLGVKTVFVDIDPKTYNLDASLLEAAITPRTKAIIPVSLYGQCCDMRAINRIAEQHQLTVIEDGAQSFGATHHGQRSGALSTIACTSFFPAKPLGCYGDGGACFTNDDALAEKLRWIRSHGQRERHDIQLVGINGRMDTLQAAILLEKLAIFPDEIKRRQQVAAWYDDVLKDLIITPFIQPDNTSVYAQYTICCHDRDALQKILKEKGVPCGIYYPKPLHVQPAYVSLGYQWGDFPHAERATQSILSLPMHPYLERASIETIADILLMAVAQEAS